MDFCEYQEKARRTALGLARQCPFYNGLGLAGEVGEVLEHIKKYYRDDGGPFESFSDERKSKVEKEMGDVLWYLASLASCLNLDLSSIAVKNLEKLDSRQKRGVLGGEGSER